MVYSLWRLPGVARQLQEAQRELVRLAVIRERLRVARDIHDLLGFRLSAIIIKGELIDRLIGTDPAAARRHLAELSLVTEQALADVRSITGRPTEQSLSLSDELETACAMLSAAGIDVRTVLAGDLPRQADSVLAIVLREAVTNVVRHSNARTCRIDTRTEDGVVRLRVTNDGPLAEPGERRGSGLANLTARAEEAGGRLTVRSDGDLFTLIAEVPLGHSAVAV